MAQKKVNIFILIFLILAVFYCCSDSVYNTSLRVQKTPVFSKDSLIFGDSTYYFLSAIDSNVFINDTFFLYREEFLDYFGEYFLHEVYVAPDKQKELKKLLSDVNFDPIERYCDPEGLIYPPDNYTHFNTFGLDDKYIEVYPYGEKCYLYSESKFTILTDSVFYYGYMLGFYPYKIKSFEKKSKNHYKMIIQDFPNDLGIIDIDTVNIYVFNDISLWDYGNLSKGNPYELFTNLEKVNKFEVIYNSCDMMRTFYIFDYPPIDKMMDILKLRE